MKRQLLPKDLLNDLQRAENIKQRIKDQLDKKNDPVSVFPRFGMRNNTFLPTSAPMFLGSSGFFLFETSFR